jgi:hypothetical protein
MIRAFALFTLSAFAAACSHATASPHPQVVAIAAPAPVDPYGGYDEIEYDAASDPNDRVAFGGQTCGPDATCNFDCDHGGCSFLCEPGSTCNVQCDGGHCKLGCAPGATCNFECDGGRCGLGCGAGATCNTQCDGGSCAQACAAQASCSLECEGGNCRG